MLRGQIARAQLVIAEKLANVLQSFLGFLDGFWALGLMDDHCLLDWHRGSALLKHVRLIALRDAVEWGADRNIVEHDTSVMDRRCCHVL